MIEGEIFNSQNNKKLLKSRKIASQNCLRIYGFGLRKGKINSQYISVAPYSLV
jgi:hypothetical protein